MMVHAYVIRQVIAADATGQLLRDVHMTNVGGKEQAIIRISVGKLFLVDGSEDASGRPCDCGVMHREVVPTKERDQ